MFAIVEAGGRQVRVEKDSLIRIDRMDASVGDDVQLSKVLLLSRGGDVQVGRPYVDGAEVRAQVKQHGRDRKITVFKYKRRKGYKVKQGHRQDYTLLQVKDISAPA